MYGNEVQHVGNEVQTYGNEVQHVGNEVQTYGNEVQHVGNEVQHVGNEVQTYGNEVQHVGNEVQTYGNEVQHVGNEVQTYGNEVQMSATRCRRTATRCSMSATRCRRTATRCSMSATRCSVRQRGADVRQRGADVRQRGADVRQRGADVRQRGAALLPLLAVLWTDGSVVVVAGAGPRRCPTARRRATMPVHPVHHGTPPQAQGPRSPARLRGPLDRGGAAVARVARPRGAARRRRAGGGRLPHPQGPDPPRRDSAATGASRRPTGRTSRWARPRAAIRAGSPSGSYRGSSARASGSRRSRWPRPSSSRGAPTRSGSRRWGARARGRGAGRQRARYAGGGVRRRGAAAERVRAGAGVPQRGGRGAVGALLGRDDAAHPAGQREHDAAGVGGGGPRAHLRRAALRGFRGPVAAGAREPVRRREYRTKRVILEIYDAMAEATRTGAPYATRLDPPPADPRVAHPPKDPATPAT